MEKSEKYLTAGFVFCIIWVLGFLWHPFGEPTALWHIIFFGMTIVLVGIGVYYLIRKEEVEIDGETFIVNRNGEEHQKTEVIEGEKDTKM